MSEKERQETPQLRMNSHEKWKLFKCHRCGKCCTEIGLPYDRHRLSDIAEFLGLTVDEVLNKYYGQRVGNKLEFEDGKRKPCPFLKSHGDKMTCGIYPVRPEGCRAYPIDTDFADQEIGCPAYKELMNEQMSVNRKSRQ